MKNDKEKTVSFEQFMDMCRAVEIDDPKGEIYSAEVRQARAYRGWFVFTNYRLSDLVGFLKNPEDYV